MPVRLSTYLKNTYGEKVYRLSLSSGCGCPNRDGSICYATNIDEYYFGELNEGDERITGGCIFCSEGGSGEFASQIDEAKALIRKKTDARKFIAYFQSFTNTYGDVDRLRALYMDAIRQDDIVALSLGTRPDCLGPEVMDMLKELNTIKPVWIELGLQTIHENTARYINRGYKLKTFEDAYRRLKEAGITVIVHVIFGLPGETRDDMLETVKYLSHLTPTLDGIKLQNLQILKGTALYDIYRDMFEDGTKSHEDKRPSLHVFSLDEYCDLVEEAIALLPKETVVHRMTGDGPRRLLVVPLWSLDKKRVLNTMNHRVDKLFD